MRKYVAALAAALTTALVAAVVGVTSQPAAGAGRFGAIQVVCYPSHSNHDDPIVFPRQPGAAHRHEFFANTSTNAYSTLGSLTGRRTTCSRSGDTAAYWTPTVYNNGRRVVPDRIIVYYRTTKIRDIASIRPFPTGLRMVAGSPMATAAKPQSTRVVNWHCGDGVLGTARPPASCPNTGARTLTLRIAFPNCWTGRTLDSADHRSHMAYAGTGGATGCPASHPVPVPELSLNFRYKIGGSLRGVRLASGGVYSAHADFFNSWKQSVLAQLVKDCLNAGRVCNSSISAAPRL